MKAEAANIASRKLTRERGEIFSAVEGQVMTPRLKNIFREADAQGLNGDARRALIRATFTKKPS